MKHTTQFEKIESEVRYYCGIRQTCLFRRAGLGQSRTIIDFLLVAAH